MEGTTIAATAQASPQMPVSRSYQGIARVEFRQQAGRTWLAMLDQQSPLRVLFPSVPDDPLPLAVLANTAGGLVGGDRLETEITMGKGAAGLVTGQAAEKVYRSAGPEALVFNRLMLADGAWLEWLPQATILFEGSRLRRIMRIDKASSARMLAGEILVFGRLARGERMTRGLLHDLWEIYCDDRLVWADALHLDGDIGATLSDPMCFGGAGAAAMLIYAGGDAPARLGLLRELIGEDGAGAASCIGSVLIARWLSTDAARLRQAFGRVWAGLRHEIAGYPPALPRIWHI